MDGEKILGIVVVFTLVFGSVILHEVAHGYMAWRLGDPTARMMGRLTLNPLAHVDPFGTVLLPFVLAFTGAPVLGWAKPVPINPSNFRDPLRGMMLTGMAGPLTNFVVALAAAILFRIFWLTDVPIGAGLSAILFQINVYLGLFNLLPIPPLDGSRVAMGLIPREWVRPYLSVERYGLFILYGIIILGLHRYILDPLLKLFSLFAGVPLIR